MGRWKRKRQPKKCERCAAPFIPTGNNCKRCPDCRIEANKENRQTYWQHYYKKKGYSQGGTKNNNWKGGVANSYYRKIAFDHYGKVCQRCGGKAVLVHHKDENRYNNELPNLEPLCKRCHQVDVHDCAKNLPDLVVFKPKPCAKCGMEFQPTGPRSTRCDPCTPLHLLKEREQKKRRKAKV